MVLGIISAIAACPAIIATTEAVRSAQQSQAREDHRGRSASLVCRLPSLCKESRWFDGALVVLRNGKLYVDIESEADRTEQKKDHPFTGFYYPYPDNQNRWKAAGFRGEGLVTTIEPSTDPGVLNLNWIYINRTTHQVCYGSKSEVKNGENFSGPWDCTSSDKRLTFEGWEGFMAVLEDDGDWGLYFDRDDDGLRGILRGRQKRVIQVLIERREAIKSKMIADEEKAENVKGMQDREKIGDDDIA